MSGLLQGFNIFNQQADLYWEAIGLEDLKTTCAHTQSPPALLEPTSKPQGELVGAVPQLQQMVGVPQIC